VIIIFADNVQGGTVWIDTYLHGGYDREFVRTGVIQVAIHLEFATFDVSTLVIEYGNAFYVSPRITCSWHPNQIIL
jgi:hypothetical protein